MNVKGTKKKNQVVTANIFEQQELWKKAEVIKENLIASTWRELETNGKFDKNENLIWKQMRKKYRQHVKDDLENERNDMVVRYKKKKQYPLY